MSRRQPPGVVLLYDPDAYEERPAPPGLPGPVGLMGRQVAGRAFLDAYLAHGTFSELGGLVRNDASAQSLIKAWREHPSTRQSGRTLRISEMRDFTSAFSAAGATILQTPQPPDPGIAWARRRLAPRAFALTGVTHTLASPRAVELIRGLVDSPFEPYDALICTSRAVADMVRRVTSDYADFLREKFGGTRQVNTSARIEVIPLGVDVERFRPSTPVDRIEARQMLGVSDDELAVLFVGRLSHHAKAHPFPMFRAASLAAESSGRAIHLLIAGWAANDAVRSAFVNGARVFAPGVRVTFLEGTDPSVRLKVWRAADVFVSLADSVQETFGLTIVEAMASGIPVIASDWNGYRDLVDEGRTGYLIPTACVQDATIEATAKLLVGALDYDHFLAESSQASAIDVAAAASALTRLASDETERLAMGFAGRARAIAHFQWSKIVHRYESLWDEQEIERSAGATPLAVGPEAYPPPERSFAAYPTIMLDDDDGVEAVAKAALGLDELLANPLTNHAPDRRVADRALILAAINEAPCTVAKLDALWSSAGVERGVGRATLAWMLKYDLIRASQAIKESATSKPVV